MKKLNQLVIFVLAIAFAGIAQTQSTTPTTQQPAGQSTTTTAPQSGQTATPQQPGQSPTTAEPGQTTTPQPGQPVTPPQPGQTTAPPQPGQTATPQPAQTTTTTTTTTAVPCPQPAQPQQKKEIKDPAEYNTYVTALGLKDPTAKANALEQFVQQYPNSVVKEDANEAEMGAYQQANNLPKAAEAASRVLQADPNNVRALLVLAFTNRAAAEGGNAQAANLSLQYGERGLQALPCFVKPEGMAEADYQKLKNVMEVVFNGAAGRGALNAKNFPATQKYFHAALSAQLAANPNDPAQLQNVYPLAVAYLSTKPIDVRGLFYVARAVDLSHGNPEITRYAKINYNNFHGGEDGFDQLLAEAQNQPTPPPNFSVAPAPSPAEQVAKIANSKDPKQMSFDDWKLIFTYGDQATVDRVWNAIKGVPLAFEALVLQADKDRLTMAATYDGIQNKTPDTEVTMAAPVPRIKIPKVGTQIAVVATPVSYDKQPYLMHLDNGKLAVTKSATSARTRKRPVHRRPK